MAWYHLNDKKETKSEYVARVKYNEIVCKKADSFMDIVDGELSKNTQYRLVTNKSFNAITVIQYLVNLYTLTEIYIAVYRMNQQSVRKLKEIINTDNVKCKIVLSSFFRENKKYEAWCNDLIAFANEKLNVDVFFAWNHAKVFLCKTNCGKHIVFEGSGNLSDNARIEQYIIEDNKTVYKFHKIWINDL